MSCEGPWVLAQDNTVAKFADKVFFAIISYKIVFTLPQTLQMYRYVAAHFKVAVGTSIMFKK